MPNVFISYSWDDDEHRSWVKSLAARLRAEGIESILDQWHAVPGDHLPEFMERSVRESDYVLIVCTPKYKERSDARTGGVGYEGDIMTGEVMTLGNHRKFIPVLRRGEWLSAAPSWLRGKYRIDMRGSDEDLGMRDLATTMLGAREQAPPVASRPTAMAGRAVPLTPKPTTAEPIRILGIVVDDVGTPRSDGTRGSALYDVPFQLSAYPPDGWEDFFIHSWNGPESFTTMHRPGIASVVGDRILLDGTTVEEVKNHHRTTLLQAVERANREYAEAVRRRAQAEAGERERQQQHRSAVIDAAKDIKFD